jgi:hypothetical protein
LMHTYHSGDVSPFLSIRSVYFFDRFRDDRLEYSAVETATEGQTV